MRSYCSTSSRAAAVRDLEGDTAVCYGESCVSSMDDEAAERSSSRESTVQVHVAATYMEVDDDGVAGGPSV